MDPLWKAMSKYRRGKYDDCIEICDRILERSPGDLVRYATSFLKLQLKNLCIKFISTE